ncbi:MAG: hypothetical protein FWE64_03815, partial [Alphaproteobacteria bacterium]|nr:hypothetical protein [Alphaproteobacteria bacterium]
TTGELAPQMRNLMNDFTVQWNQMYAIVKEKAKSADKNRIVRIQIPEAFDLLQRLQKIASDKNIDDKALEAAFFVHCYAYFGTNEFMIIKQALSQMRQGR